MLLKTPLSQQFCGYYHQTLVLGSLQTFILIITGKICFRSTDIVPLSCVVFKY